LREQFPTPNTFSFQIICAGHANFELYEEYEVQKLKYQHPTLRVLRPGHSNIIYEIVKPA